MNPALLRVENLRTYFQTPHGLARAVDGVSFTIDRGETLALVGESGCGKSVTGLSLLQLVPEPAGYIEDGRVLFEGADVLDHSWEEMRQIRGRDITMIFQEPMTSLNPTYSVGWQVVETVRLHNRVSRREARRRSEEALARAGLPEAAQVMRQYPHELSGGMRQRVMIAMALVNRPGLLIADEPTTALDVTVQAQILALLRALQQESGMAVLLITHDLAIVSEVSDRVAVMYAGQLVEAGPTQAVFRAPRHPYTQGLLASRPSRARRGQELATLEGRVPEATAWPPACRFEPRCPRRSEQCAATAPDEVIDSDGAMVRCYLWGSRGQPSWSPADSATTPMPPETR